MDSSKSERRLGNNRLERHHSVPRSRGGTDDEWNFEDLTEYEHAYEHALDFVLFESAPWFDCRMAGWRLLPNDLRDAVRNEQSRRASLRIGSLNTNWGNNKLAGIPRSPEVIAKIKANADRRPKSAEHRKKLSEAKKGVKMAPQPPNNPNRISGALRGWETRRKNQQK